MSFNCTGYELQTLGAALRQSRATWVTAVKECELGLRPSMSQDGAEAILGDLNRLIARLPEGY